jgi:hypothetical protein
VCAWGVHRLRARVTWRARFKLVDGNDWLLRQRTRSPLGHHWRSLQFNDAEGSLDLDTSTLQAACDHMPPECMLLIEQLGGAYRTKGGGAGSGGGGEPSIAFRRSPFLLFVVGRFEATDGAGSASVLPSLAPSATPASGAGLGASGGHGAGGGAGGGAGAASAGAVSSLARASGGGTPAVPGGSQRAVVVAWVRSAASAFALYVNRPLCACNSGVDSPEAVWGALAPFLRASKRRFDPENYLRRNTNIPATG